MQVFVYGANVEMTGLKISSSTHAQESMKHRKKENSKL